MSTTTHELEAEKARLSMAVLTLRSELADLEKGKQTFLEQREVDALKTVEVVMAASKALLSEAKDTVNEVERYRNTLEDAVSDIRKARTQFDQFKDEEERRLSETKKMVEVKVTDMEERTKELSKQRVALESAIGQNNVLLQAIKTTQQEVEQDRRKLKIAQDLLKNRI